MKQYNTINSTYMYTYKYTQYNAQTNRYIEIKENAKKSNNLKKKRRYIDNQL